MKLHWSAAFATVASILGAIAAISDPSMPTSVKVWCGIGAVIITSVSQAIGHALPVVANQQAIAAKALAVQELTARAVIAQNTPPAPPTTPPAPADPIRINSA